MTKNILFLGFLLPFISLFMQKCKDSNSSLNLIREDGNITKVKIKIGSSAGLKEIEIASLNELDSINMALKDAQEIDVQPRGAFEITAHLDIYKNKKKAFVMVHFSKYHGKTIEIDSKVFKSDYIFNLIEKYSGKVIK